MADFEKKNKLGPHSELDSFIHTFEALINEKEYKQAKSLLSTLKHKEQRFLNKVDNRKEQGVYYTPPKLTKFIITRMILTYLRNESSFTLDSLEEINNLKKEDQGKIINILLNTTLCDPSCGSGNFLINACRILFRLSEEFCKEYPLKNIKVQILKNVHGFDINSRAVNLCKLKLIEWTVEDKFSNIRNYDIIKTILNDNIQERNSLIDSSDQQFDLVIGNPPYGNILSESEKKILKNQNIYFKDAYCAFLLKSLEICSGYVGFLIPKSFLLRQSYIEFRNKFLSNTDLLELYNIGSNEFKNATNEVQILIYSKKNGDEKDLKVYTFPEKEIIRYKGQNFDDLRICVNSNCPHINLTKNYFLYTYQERCPSCNSTTIPLNRIRIKSPDHIFNLATQIEQKGDLNYLNINEFPELIRGEEAEGLKKVKQALEEATSGDCYYIDAKYDFQYFYFQKSQKFNLKSINAEILKGSSKEYYTEPKLLIKHNNIYPEALFTEENSCFTSSIYSLLHKNKNELKYLCALLNSPVIHFYCIYAINNQNDTTINLNQYMIRHLPIRTINSFKKQEIAEHVDIISREFEQNKGKLNEHLKYKLIALNKSIFELYNFEKTQQKIIIKEVKKYNSFFKLLY